MRVLIFRSVLYLIFQNENKFFLLFDVARYVRVKLNIYASLILHILTRNSRRILATIIETTLKDAPMTPATGLCGMNVGGLPFSHLYSDISWKDIKNKKYCTLKKKKKMSKNVRFEKQVVIL